MKKTLSIAIIALLLIAGLFILTGCSNLEEVKLPLQIDFLERTVTATIGYPKDVTVEDTNWETSKIFKNEKNNYTLEISITEDSTYANNKEYDSEEEGYEEVKFGDFSGYIVKGTFDIEGKILLEDLSDQNAYVYLNLELEPIEDEIDDKKVDLYALYKLDEVQKILKSIKYDKGENTTEKTKEAIKEKEEEKKTSNYGEFKDRPRTEGTSDKEGLIFIPSYESPNPDLYKAEQSNDNVGVDNYLWYDTEKSAYTDSGIEVRIFPKTGTYENIDEYIEEKGDMYHWSKAKIGGVEYNIYEFGSNPSKPAKYSEYYSGAFMVGNKVVEFSYNMFAEIPDQDLGQKFFKQIIDSIEYSKEFTK